MSARTAATAICLQKLSVGILPGELGKSTMKQKVTSDFIAQWSDGSVATSEVRSSNPRATKQLGTVTGLCMVSWIKVGDVE